MTTNTMTLAALAVLALKYCATAFWGPPRPTSAFAALPVPVPSTRSLGMWPCKARLGNHGGAGRQAGPDFLRFLAQRGSANSLSQSQQPVLHTRSDHHDASIGRRTRELANPQFGHSHLHRYRQVRRCTRSRDCDWEPLVLGGAVWWKGQARAPEPRI